MTAGMTFRCDTCDRDYEARSGNAWAHVYVEDARCNHVRVRCPHCNALEVIYLRPRRFEEVVRDGELSATVHSEASDDLRRRAARAWSEAEAAVAGPGSETGLEGAVAAEPTAPPEPTVRTYPLTARHEVLLRSFGVTLDNMPLPLFWEELQGQHERRHPERWID